VRRNLRRASRWGGGGLLALAALLAGLVAIEVARLPDVRVLAARAPASTVLLDREGRPLRYALTPGGDLAPRVPLARIAPLLRSATIAAEDSRFRSHFGVDILAVARALWTDLRRARVVSGASTITMQVARLLRPLDRSLYGKFREMVLAVAIERAFTKDEVLELYLNLSPYGGNARGVEAASLRYFGRPASDLTLAEAALIAGLPQAPSRLRPDRHPEAARARRDRVLDRMAALGMIGAGACAEAKAAPVRLDPRPLPFEAPHFAIWAARRVPQGERARTSLDPSIQRMAEDVLRARLEALGAQGVRDGAVVVVETETAKVRALVGSGDFLAPRGGQVNGAIAPRSPGSLLKPFIYGLAFERGIAGPSTVLRDRPRRFADGYEPRNFGEEFSGPVTARDALVRSLNVPAVDILARLGVRAAIERMRAFGLRSIRRDAGHYGLALGLGGVEVPLVELVEAYASIGRGGRHLPLSVLEDEPPPEADRVLSERAARQLADILEAVAAPAAEREAGLKLPRIAMKTGTSFGLRDAWAIGATPLWTVGVWLGNPDGASSPALVGRSAAVPAALAILRRLQETEAPWLAGGGGPDGGPRPPRELWPVFPGAVSWMFPPDRATFVPHGRAGGRELLLRADIEDPVGLGRPGGAPARGVEGGTQAISWFLDGAFIGRSIPGATMARPIGPGAHRVILVGPDGKAQARTVNVAP